VQRGADAGRRFEPHADGENLGALAHLDKRRFLHLVLTDPTTAASRRASRVLGDLNIGRAGALIGFAGPRVIEQTIRQNSLQLQTGNSWLSTE